MPVALLCLSENKRKTHNNTQGIFPDFSRSRLLGAASTGCNPGLFHDPAFRLAFNGLQLGSTVESRGRNRGAGAGGGFLPGREEFLFCNICVQKKKLLVFEWCRMPVTLCPGSRGSEGSPTVEQLVLVLERAKDPDKRTPYIEYSLPLLIYLFDLVLDHTSFSCCVLCLALRDFSGPVSFVGLSLLYPFRGVLGIFCYYIHS